MWPGALKIPVLELYSSALPLLSQCGWEDSNPPLITSFQTNSSHCLTASEVTKSNNTPFVHCPFFLGINSHRVFLLSFSVRIYSALLLAQAGCLSLPTNGISQQACLPYCSSTVLNGGSRNSGVSRTRKVPVCIFTSTLAWSIRKTNSRKKTCFFLQLERILVEEQTGIYFELFLIGKFKRLPTQK